MAVARKCDLCGEFYDIKSDVKFNGLILTKETRFDSPVSVKGYDLCLSCATMLEEWLNVKGEKNGDV